MGKLPAIKPKELIKKLEKLGFIIQRTTGSHMIYKHPRTGLRAMDWKSKILKSLEDEIDVLEKALETAKIAQRNAPSAMESASNTTRSEMERMITALEIDINKVRENIKKLENYEPKYFELDKLKLVLVPDGIGGRKIEGVMLVSETSPIGRKLLS